MFTTNTLRRSSHCSGKKKKEKAKPHKVRFSWFGFTKHLKRHPCIQLRESNNIKQWTIHKIICSPTKNNQTHRATRRESTGLAKAAAWHQVCTEVTITTVNYFNWQRTSTCGIILSSLDGAVRGCLFWCKTIEILYINGCF